MCRVGAKRQNSRATPIESCLAWLREWASPRGLPSLPTPHQVRLRRRVPRAPVAPELTDVSAPSLRRQNGRTVAQVELFAPWGVLFCVLGDLIPGLGILFDDRRPPVVSQLVQSRLVVCGSLCLGGLSLHIGLIISGCFNLSWRGLGLRVGHIIRDCFDLGCRGLSLRVGSLIISCLACSRRRLSLRVDGLINSCLDFGDRRLSLRVDGLINSCLDFGDRCLS